MCAASPVRFIGEQVVIHTKIEGETLENKVEVEARCGILLVLTSLMVLDVVVLLVISFSRMQGTCVEYNMSEG